MWRWVFWLAVYETTMLSFSVVLWGHVPLHEWEPDTLIMLRYVMRMLIVVPLATALAIAGVRLFDHFTENDWLKAVVKNEMACAVVLAALILGVFWLCIQG